MKSCCQGRSTVAEASRAWAGSQVVRLQCLWNATIEKREKTERENSWNVWQQLTKQEIVGGVHSTCTKERCPDPRSRSMICDQHAQFAKLGRKITLSGFCLFFKPRSLQKWWSILVSTSRDRLRQWKIIVGQEESALMLPTQSILWSLWPRPGRRSESVSHLWLSQPVAILMNRPHWAFCSSFVVNWHFWSVHWLVAQALLGSGCGQLTLSLLSRPASNFKGKMGIFRSKTAIDSQTLVSSLLLQDRNW